MHTTRQYLDAQQQQDFIAQPISRLPMEVEALRYLVRIGVQTIEDLLKLTEKDLQGLLESYLLEEEKPSKQKAGRIRNNIIRSLNFEGLSLANK